MKRFLILLLVVLGLATVSTAAMVDVQINGGSRVNGTDGVTPFNVLITDVVTITWMTPGVYNDTFGGYSGVDVDTSGAGAAFSNFVPIAPTLGSYLGNTFAIVGGNVTGGTTGMPHPVGDMFSVDITFTSTGTALFDTVQGSYGTGALLPPIMGSIGGGDGWAYEVFNVVVPEPATMALLGLGGLFLRRRKK